MPSLVGYVEKLMWNRELSERKRELRTRIAFRSVQAMRLRTHRMTACSRSLYHQASLLRRLEKTAVAQVFSNELRTVHQAQFAFSGW